jgi:hypothetical protein
VDGVTGRAQLIVDCGGKVLSAFLLTPDGDLLPWSQQIHGVAMRHVSLQLLFDPSISQRSDFSWDEAMESLAGTGAHNLLQRARRIGLQRPWDGPPPHALLVDSPLGVLSSTAAAGRGAQASTLRMSSAALLEALLHPCFAFVTERAAPATTDAVVVLPSHTGRLARLVLHSIFRRRGYRLNIVHREAAVAMSLIEEPPPTCVVCDITDDDLRLQVVASGTGADGRTFDTVATRTVCGMGRRHWVQQIAAALERPWPLVDRALTSLLTGCPDSGERLTHATIDAACDAAWQERQRAALGQKIDLSAGEPMALAGDLCAIAPLRRTFGGDMLQTPYPDRAARGVATAALWLRANADRTVSMPLRGSIRVSSYGNATVPLLSAAQFPPPGQSCSIESRFQVDAAGGNTTSFLLHILRGDDHVQEGNTVLCAVPASAQDDGSLSLRLHVRRSRGGRRLSGIVETGVARASFAEQLPALGRSS